MKLALLVIHVMIVSAMYAQNQTLPLYQNGITCENDHIEEISRDGIGRRITKVNEPSLSIFLPKKEIATGTGVLICPGGGYYLLAWDWEGIEIAKWLNSMGVAAFVLKYRLPHWESDHCRDKVALMDAKRAMRLIRKNADTYEVDINRIGVMGFSAGGHLASTLSTHFDNGDANSTQVIETFNSRPDFSILMYPVISMDPTIAHMGSRKNLLGDSPSDEMLLHFSNEKQIKKDTPPTLLIHANDDKAVPPENSLVYYRALREKGIPASLHIFERGGHGFALAKGKGATEQWTSICNGWLKDNGLLQKKFDNGLFPAILPSNQAIPSGSSLYAEDLLSGHNYIAQRWDNKHIIFLNDNHEEAIDANNFKIHIVPQNTDNQNITIKIDDDKGVINVTNGERQVLKYHLTEKLPPSTPGYYMRGGFIHPLVSPKGKVLTDGFPSGHTHQHGLFSALVNTRYKGDRVDFWNQQEQTATVRHSRLIESEDGPVFSTFTIELDYISSLHGMLMKERWKVKVYNSQPSIVEISSNFKSVAEDTVFIDKYHYGGLAFRGSKKWNRSDTTHFQNDVEFLTNDEFNREDANHSRPTWTAAFGKLNGEYAGIAAFGHPQNFRYPQPIRVHPQMPYFCYAPMVEGGYSLLPGEQMQNKYTFVVYDGKPNVALLNKLVKSYQSILMPD